MHISTGKRLHGKDDTGWELLKGIVIMEQEDITLTKEVYQKFLSGYSGRLKLSREEILSFPYWVAIRHFQLQATILEIYGVDSIDEGFIDGQLYWLNRWQEAIQEFTDGL